MHLRTFFSDENISATNFIAAENLLPFWELKSNPVFIYHLANLIIWVDGAELN
jgi:hypothetical protein